MEEFNFVEDIKLEYNCPNNVKEIIVYFRKNLNIVKEKYKELKIDIEEDDCIIGKNLNDSNFVFLKKIKKDNVLKYIKKNKSCFLITPIESESFYIVPFNKNEKIESGIDIDIFTKCYNCLFLNINGYFIKFYIDTGTTNWMLDISFLKENKIDFYILTIDKNEKELYYTELYLDGTEEDFIFYDSIEKNRFVVGNIYFKDKVLLFQSGMLRYFDTNRFYIDNVYVNKVEKDKNFNMIKNKTSIIKRDNFNNIFSSIKYKSKFCFSFDKENTFELLFILDTCGFMNLIQNKKFIEIKEKTNIFNLNLITVDYLTSIYGKINVEIYFCYFYFNGKMIETEIAIDIDNKLGVNIIGRNLQKYLTFLIEDWSLKYINISEEFNI